VAGEVRRIDLLRLTIGNGRDARTRYAHSYIGMGLTPVVAVDLEKGGKGSLKEIMSVVRTFAKFRPFTMQLEDGTRRSFVSLLFANIAEMAKYATLSETGSPTTDGSR
jgi:diacylglycerol kinase (ATP)